MKQSDQLKLLLRHNDDLDDHESRVSLLERQMEALMATKKTSRRRKKKNPNEFDLDVTKLNDMSDTELVQVAWKLKHPNASRQMLREDLISLILGEVQSAEDPLHQIRKNTYRFVKGNERLMKSLMDCSLHCPTCPHHQVVECYSVNHDIVDDEDLQP